MNTVHIHLIITHLPIFGTILGTIVLLYGIKTKSIDTLNASYFVFLIATLGAAAAYLTGEGAEEAVEHIQGVSKSMIEVHEDSANFVLVSMGFLAVSSGASLFINFRKGRYVYSAAILTMILSLASFGFSAYTGFLDGKIMHHEINDHVQKPAKKIENNQRLFLFAALSS